MSSVGLVLPHTNAWAVVRSACLKREALPSKNVAFSDVLPYFVFVLKGAFSSSLLLLLSGCTFRPKFIFTRPVNLFQNPFFILAILEVVASRLAHVKAKT